MTWAAYLLGFILSTLYGAAFHFLVGGNFRRLVLFMLAGWLGFALGHLVGDYFGIDVLAIGPLNVLTATIGAGLALIGARFFALKPPPSTR